MGVALRDASSAPSLGGFALTLWASALLPGALPGAVFAGLFVSDPGQIWHVGDRHASVANTVSKALEELEAALKDPGFDTPKAKENFDARMTAFTKAFQGTTDQHGTLELIMKIAAGVVQALGVASLNVGYVFLDLARTFLAAAAVPGADLVAYGGANAAAGRLSMTMRAMAKPFLQLIIKIKNLLGFILKGSVTRKLAIAGLGTFGYTTLKTPVTNMAASALPIPNKNVKWPSAEPT